MKRSATSRRLLLLSKWLRENEVPPLDFLKASFKGEAPPVVIFADELYLDDADESRWRMRLGATASRRTYDLLAREFDDAR
jgi:hypothetical protein